jgi:nucleotide-binding universal stress UspA family protein
MNIILVPTDFSDNAMHAARYAATLARVYDAKIVFLNIYTIPVWVEYEVMSNMNTDLVQMQKIAELNLTDFKNDFIAKTNFAEEKVSFIAEYGQLPNNIIEMAESQKITMIVMGTKGTTNLLESWLGTNAQKVIKEARCPVWVIPQNAKLEYPQNIIYAADFEENEILATKQLLELATPLGATCKVLHVHEFFEPNVGHKIEVTIAELENEFDNENISFKDINRPDIIEGLEKYIEGANPDVLAFTIHEKSFWAKIFETSISTHFVQKANLPLLIFSKMELKD